MGLAREGFKVFPIAANAKHPPLLNGWPQKASSDPAEIEMMWLPLPDANIGIHCEGLLVLDVDVKKGGNDALAKLELLEGLPATRRTLTPSGGQHLFFRLPANHPGVPNSVGAVGAGLDVRSTGGYVVAPGSTVAAGAYAFADPAVALADAPDWLIERAGAARAQQAGTRGTVLDAPDAVVERAREWLKTAPRSIKGQGGDQMAYFVACNLRDLGVSYGQACDLMRSDAWDYGCGWREGRLEQKPIRSAYRYATGEAGAKAASPEEFPLLDPAPAAAPAPRKHSRVLSMAQLAAIETTGSGYVVKGLLQRGSYAEAYGAPGEGKTFVALDIGYHVAGGLPWMGRKVKQGLVLYLAYEGHGGMVKRMKAIRQKYGKDQPLHVVAANFDLRDKAGRQDLGSVLAELPEKPILIIVDTFARALMGGDENSAQDVGAFNSAIAALIESTGACVMIIHHSGKDKTKGARGSSALLGALDTEIEVDGGQVIARKQRDVEIADPIGFKLVPLVVGVDEDGDEVTSCAVDSAAVSAGQGLSRISGNAKRGFDLLCALRPNNGPISPPEWREACKEFLGDKNVAQRFYDIQKTLLAKGYIVKDDDGLIRRKMT